MNKIPYYYRQSWGIGTNLQLHSLRQAWNLWKELQTKRSDLKPARIRERCVVIISLLGLSISQLLGQNFSNSNTGKIPSPKCLLGNFIKSSDLPVHTQSDIKHKFGELISFYDAIRHFGIPKHEKINRLTFEKTGGMINFSIELWDTVCHHFKSKRTSPISFASIREIIEKTGDNEDVDD